MMTDNAGLSPQGMEERLSRAACDVAADAADKAARQAVKDILERLGFDTDDPRSVRRDADWLREARLRSADPEFQKDRLYLRRQREAHEQIVPAMRRTTIGIVLTGIAAALWVGIRHTVGS